MPASMAPAAIPAQRRSRPPRGCCRRWAARPGARRCARRRPGCEPRSKPRERQCQRTRRDIGRFPQRVRDGLLRSLDEHRRAGVVGVDDARGAVRQHFEQPALRDAYASMSRWKSRWSRVRFVNTPAANRVPSTRRSARAWDDTSMTAAPAGIDSPSREAWPASRAPRAWFSWPRALHRQGCTSPCPSDRTGDRLLRIPRAAGTRWWSFRSCR